MDPLLTSTEVAHFLEVGAPVTVQTKIGHKDFRARAFLRGWSPSKYVYLESASEANDGLTRLTKGTDCIVRSVRGARAYAYEARVLMSEHGLNGYDVHIAWPRVVSYSAFRDSERVPLDVPCRLELGEDDQRTGRVRDISVSGLALEVREKVPAGTELRVSFELPDNTSLDGLVVDVVNCIVKEGEIVLGCKYQTFQQHELADISFFVFASQARERAAAFEGAPKAPPVILIGPAEGDLSLIKYQIKQAGHEVLLAHNAVDGLARLRLSGAHAAIVAEDLPDLTGSVVCRAVRANPKLGGVALFRYGALDAENGDGHERVFDSRKQGYVESIGAAVASVLGT